MKICKKSLFGVIFLCLFVILASCSGNTGTLDGTSRTENSSESNTSGTENSGDDGIVLFDNGKTAYKVVRGDRASQTEIDAALVITKAFKESTGTAIGITTDWDKKSVSEYEIVVGKTTRAEAVGLDTSSLGRYDYIIKVIDHRIFIVGGGELATLAAAEDFALRYLYASGENLNEIIVPKTLDVSGMRDSSNIITVLSQNLLATDTEYASHPNASQYTIAKRYPRILKVFENNEADIIGVQECSASWRTILDSRLPSNFTRLGADKNEKIGIIYNNQKFKLIDSGSFWLSPNPESQKIAYEWSNNKEGTIERLGQYAVFEIIANGNRFIMFNTHIGFETATLSTNQTQVLLDYIAKVKEKYDYPVVITGDFNYNSSSSQHQLFTSGIMEDTKKLARKSSGAGSFSALVDDNRHSLAIDQVMVSEGDWTVFEYYVDYTKFDGLYASDHFAVVAKLELVADSKQ